MPKTTTKPSRKSKTTSSIIKELEAFIKAYDKQKQAQAELDSAKLIAIEYLQSHVDSSNKIKYKDHYLSLCERNTYNYSELVDEMLEAMKKQKKLEELNGEATIKTSTEYILLNKIK